MTIEEAKLLYPTSKPEQFEPHGDFKVGDRVTGRVFGELRHGTIAKFWQVKNTPDSVMVRVHYDDGQRAWNMISKINPETATSGEGQTTTTCQG